MINNNFWFVLYFARTNLVDKQNKKKQHIIGKWFIIASIAIKFRQFILSTTLKNFARTHACIHARRSARARLSIFIYFKCLLSTNSSSTTTNPLLRPYGTKQKNCAYKTCSRYHAVVGRHRRRAVYTHINSSMKSIIK